MKNKQSPWVRWQEVAEYLECSRSMVYKVIRRLNDELRALGFWVYNGRVSRAYFYERYHLA